MKSDGAEVYADLYGDEGYFKTDDGREGFDVELPNGDRRYTILRHTENGMRAVTMILGTPEETPQKTESYDGVPAGAMAWMGAALMLLSAFMGAVEAVNYFAWQLGYILVLIAGWDAVKLLRIRWSESSRDSEDDA